MKIWSICDDKAGNRRQADALAAAVAQRLGVGWEAIELRPRAPWRSAAPRWLPAADSRLDGDYCRRLLDEPPGLAIGCGRIAALATRIAARSGRSRTVQILDPRLPGPHWDLRVIPRHDRHRCERTLLSLGSLNPIDDDWLAQSRRQFAEFEAWPRPRIGFLLGGPTNDARWGRADLRAWWSAAQQRRELSGGSLILLGSRRAPLAAPQWIDADPDRAWWSEHDGCNPYAGLLGWADELWVSPDSVNMLSEAAATRARVVVLPARRLRGRLAAFHRALQDSGRVQTPAAAGAGWSGSPLCEVAGLADQVIARLRLAVAEP